MSRRALRGLPQWRLATKGIAMELAIMLFSVLALITALVATVVVSSRSTDDLLFVGARSEMSSMIAEHGAQNFEVRRVAAPAKATNASPYDSLAIVGDTIAAPALAKGGFVRDQIDQFNAFEFRRAWERELTGRDDLRDRAALLLRLVRTENGEQLLSERLNTGALVVTSPSSVRQSVTLYTSDWMTGPGIVGLSGQMSLGGNNGSLSRATTLSHSPCAVKTVDPTRQLLYCGGLAGAKVNQSSDLDIGTTPKGMKGPLSLTHAGKDALWNNGKKIKSPAVAHTGDIFFTARTGAGAFSDMTQGMLAGPQWINGRTTISTVDHGTLRFFARASQTMTASADGKPITLSIDGQLTNTLDAQIERFVREHRDIVQSMSVVVADVASGELKAIAEGTQTTEAPLFAFEPVLIGSMSKPLIAAAILSQQPALARLVVDRVPAEIATVGGLPLRHAMGNPTNTCGARIDFTAFLSCSSNQYAAELLVTSLQQTAGRRDIERRAVVPNELLERSALASGILDLYHDADVVARRSDGRSAGVWQLAHVANAATDHSPHDAGLRPWVSRPWFIEPKKPGTSLDLLARFAIGGWENRWTLVGALEGYLRIATNRRTHLTVLPHATVSRAEIMPAPATNAFREVRNGLRGVALLGTAAGLAKTMSAISPTPDSVVVLAKTGTLNETEAGEENGVFLKALAVVAGYPQSAETGAPLRCGIGTVVYVQFRQDWKQRSHAAAGARLPGLHLQFVAESLAPVLQEFWKRGKPCARG